ncbi:MAG: helix-turn-helix domain-containing protein [Actinobacteria bacterium]|nr:helix-turn-helix domain-containing protein [Actinomycetota bacterium]
MTTKFQTDDNHENDEMLSIEEAAAFLRVPVATMRYWRYCGDGPFSFRLGRHVRYWRTELILWRGDQGRRPDDGGAQA